MTKQTSSSKINLMDEFLAKDQSSQILDCMPSKLVTDQTCEGDLTMNKDLLDSKLDLN